MIPEAYFLGEEAVSRVYLGEYLVYQNKLPLPEYLLRGKSDEAVDIAVDNLTSQE